MIADLRFYLRLLPRRLPVMIVLFLSTAIAGVILAQRLPSVYTASAALLVESAQISNDRDQANNGQSDASEQLQVIQQRLLTRTNLIDIANEVGVFPDQRDMSPDEIVLAMREASQIALTIGRDQATLMRLSFESDSPTKVAQVVNRYVDIALQISSTTTTSQAEDTAAFYEQQVQRYSDELDAQSGRIAAFKRENADALPENLDYNQTRQSLLQERVSRAERELDSLSTQRANIVRVFEATGSVGAQPATALTNEERLLLDLEGELSVARSIYSPSNPRVRSLETQVDALKQRLAAAAEGDDDGPQTPALSAQRTALQISLAEIDSRSSTLEQEIADANEELGELRDSIARIPANGIVLSGLEREQDNIQNLYAGVVSRLAEAQTSLNIVSAAKGERITVLEAASVPDEPSSPNRQLIALIGIGAGLGLAAGFFMLLEFLNQNVRRPVDIVKRLEVTPLATIPRIETIAQRRWRRVAQIGASLVVLTSVPVILWSIDTYFMPLDLLFERVRDRLI